MAQIQPPVRCAPTTTVWVVVPDTDILTLVFQAWGQLPAQHDLQRLLEPQQVCTIVLFAPPPTTSLPDNEELTRLVPPNSPVTAIQPTAARRRPLVLRDGTLAVVMARRAEWPVTWGGLRPSSRLVVQVWSQGNRKSRVCSVDSIL